MTRDEPQHEANSFTFLRLILALTVVVGHDYVLGGFGEEPLARWSHGQTSGRELAVQGFFILSGWLLTQSLLRQPSLLRFAVRRAFRILPAYWLALLVTSFVVAPSLFAHFFPGRLSYVESLTLGDHHALSYLVRNSLLWQGQKWILPLFMQNHLPAVINGSLWSIFYEALCYAALMLAAALGLLARRGWMAGGFLALFLGTVVHAVAPFPALPKGPALFEMINMAFHPAGPGVVLAFASGVLARVLAADRPVWQSRWFLFACLALAVSVPLHAVRVIAPLALPYLLICLGERLPCRRFERFGDPSYGIYIYSFLLEQCLFAWGWPRAGFWTYLALSIAGSVVAGWVSWLALERPAIRCGQRLVSRWTRPREDSPAIAAATETGLVADTA